MAQNKTDLFIDILTRDKTKGGIKSAEGGLKTFTKNAAKLGGAYAGVAAITTKTFQTMEDAQAQVANVLGKSTKEIRQQYTSNVKAIANETGQPLEVVWRNLYDVVSAGNEGADAFAVLRQAGKLAFAGNADYTSSTKLLLNTMVDQKVELKDLDKVMKNQENSSSRKTQAVNNDITSIEDKMGSVMSKFGGEYVLAAGRPFEEIITLVGSIGLAGSALGGTAKGAKRVGGTVMGSLGRMSKFKVPTNWLSGAMGGVDLLNSKLGGGAGTLGLLAKLAAGVVVVISVKNAVENVKKTGRYDVIKDNPAFAVPRKALSTLGITDNLFGLDDAGASINVPFVSGNPNTPTGRSRTKLARGGIVTRPTNAIIGEAGPEAVIPLDKAKKKGFGTTNVYVNGVIVGTQNELAKLIDEALTKRIMGNTKMPINISS